MADVKIKVLDNGPLQVKGDIEIVDPNDKLLATKQSVSLCRCGHSDNKPFCDGSHKGTFESEVRADD